MIVALLADPRALAGISAGCEEEGVPLVAEAAPGDAASLARLAARRSPLGIGIGGDARSLALALAASPGRPYITAAAVDGRALGHAAGRLAARRPLGALPASTPSP